LGHVLVKTKYLILCSAPSRAVALNDSGILLEYCPWSLMVDATFTMAEPVGDIGGSGSKPKVVNGVTGSTLRPFPYRT
jgi:hypothetical protein